MRRQPVESTARRPVEDVRDGSLAEVARYCWVIYQKAADTYRVLANNAMSEEISRLWRDMAEGMNKHILYWKKIFELVERDPSLEVLGNPHEAINQLRHVVERIDVIQESSAAFLMRRAASSPSLPLNSACGKYMLPWIMALCPPMSLIL